MISTGLISRLIARVTLALAIPVTAQAAHHYTTAEQQLLTTQIAAVLKKNPSINVGIDVRSIETGQIIYQFHANRLYSPASSLKILTAAAGLLLLGRDFRYETTLFQSGTLSDHTLRGNLYLIFQGDPDLTIEHLKQLLTAVAAQGIHTVEGNIYVDNTAFGRYNFAPGWMLDDTRFCYSAPINAAIINRNCMPYSLIPANQAGKRADMKVNADYRYIPLDNQVNTVDKNDAAACLLSMDIDHDNTFHLSGCLAKGRDAVALAGAINNVDRYSDAVLRELLETLKITLNGKIIHQKVTPSGTLIAHHVSEPLSELIKPMLKKSDNIIANAIFHKIGQQYYHQNTTWSTSEKALLATLHKNLLLDTKNVVAIDGSGESRYDLVSAEFLSELLTKVRQHAIGTDFYEALSITGIDGTLRYRLSDKKMLQRFRGKSGSMASTSSVAGYLRTARGDLLAVTIIINGFKGSLHPYRRIEDDIIRAVAAV